MRTAILQARPTTVLAFQLAPIAVALAIMVASPDALGPGAMRLAVLGAFIATATWLWVVATSLNRRIDPSVRPATAGFQLALAYVALYVPGFLSGLIAREFDFAWMAVLHMGAMAASLYFLHFLATNLALAERKGDGSWPTTGLLSSPAGMFEVQRRVNALFAESAPAPARD